MLPFVKLFYSEPSSYLWQDDAGDVHNILQGDGGKQGDGLVPMMYALGQHDGLDEARTLLPPSDALITYLDEIYLPTQEQHATASVDTVTTCIKTNCGVDVNLSKCVAWSHAGGPAPAGLE